MRFNTGTRMTQISWINTDYSPLADEGLPKESKFSALQKKIRVHPSNPCYPGSCIFLTTILPLKKKEKLFLDSNYRT